MQLNRVDSTGASRQARSASEVFDGALNWSNDLKMQSSVKISWDGDDDPSTYNPTGLGNVDLTLKGKINTLALRLLSADLDGLTVKFRVDSGAGNYSTLTKTFGPISATSPQTDYYRFSDFMVGAGTGANFSKVSAIKMLLTGPKEIDASIAFVQAVTEPGTEVPEPTSWLALAGVGVLGATARRNKRQPKL
jgi:hypothetical protein